MPIFELDISSGGIILTPSNGDIRKGSWSNGLEVYQLGDWVAWAPDIDPNVVDQLDTLDDRLIDIEKTTDYFRNAKLEEKYEELKLAGEYYKHVEEKLIVFEKLKESCNE